MKLHIIGVKQWPFHIVQINTNNINNYLERDNGAHQYIWVVHPTVLSLGLVVVSPKLSIIYNQINKEVKWHEI